MNWDQIEVKWGAMTRRVRSDLPRTLQAAPELCPIAGPSMTPPDDVPEPPQAQVKLAHVG